MENRSTEDLSNILNNIKNKSELQDYIDSSKSIYKNHKLTEYILKICESKGYNKSNIIRNADINRTYGYQILNGSRAPSRDKILQICIGNKFNVDETNRTLTLGKLGILYPKSPRDSAILFALKHKLNLINTNLLLEENNLTPIGDI
ncbi:MAG TPA: hypothetical protein VK087_01715 [Tissierellaceae bacterium]|nr:hypothetical protein [Tissierellaceae bacterium]